MQELWRQLDSEALQDIEYYIPINEEKVENIKWRSGGIEEKLTQQDFDEYNYLGRI